MPEQKISRRRTLVVTLILTTICAFLVTSAATLLKPRQQAWLAVEQNRSIIAAAGLAADARALTPGEVVALFGNLDAQLIELETGTPSRAADPITFRFFDATAEEADAYRIPPALDAAQLGVRPKTAPVYLLRDGTALKRVILPVYGAGMWSTISAYIALEGDLNTIASLYFYRHGETPGIGDQIEGAEWRRHWTGKEVRDDAGVVKLELKQESATKQAAIHQIDGISGATVTTSAVVSMMQYWLGDDGYGPYLNRLAGESES